MVIAQDGSIVLAGWTDGDFYGANAGSTDFFAVKLNPEMEEIWRWQASNRAGCSQHPAPRKRFRLSTTRFPLGGLPRLVWKTRVARDAIERWMRLLYRCAVLTQSLLHA